MLRRSRRGAIVKQHASSGTRAWCKHIYRYLLCVLCVMWARPAESARERNALDGWWHDHDAVWVVVVWSCGRAMCWVYMPSICDAEYFRCLRKATHTERETHTHPHHTLPMAMGTREWDMGRFGYRVHEFSTRARRRRQARRGVITFQVCGAHRFAIFFRSPKPWGDGEHYWGCVVGVGRRSCRNRSARDDDGGCLCKTRAHDFDMWSFGFRRDMRDTLKITCPSLHIVCTCSWGGVVSTTTQCNIACLNVRTTRHPQRYISDTYKESYTHRNQHKRECSHVCWRTSKMKWDFALHIWDINAATLELGSYFLGGMKKVDINARVGEL